MVPDITYLVTSHPDASLHIFGIVIFWETKNTLLFFGDFLVTIDLSSALVTIDLSSALVTIDLSSVLVHIRLLSPLFVRFVDVGKHFFIRVSSRFGSKLRRTKYFVPNEIEPERQQNDQAAYTKLPQEVAVTVTKANQKVMPENAGTKCVSILQLITRVTILILYSPIIGQIAQQQCSPSFKKKIATLNHKLLGGWN